MCSLKIYYSHCLNWTLWTDSSYVSFQQIVHIYSQQTPFSCGHTGCWRAHDDLHWFPFKFCSGEIEMNASLCQVLISQCAVWKGIVATLWPTTFGPAPVIYTPNKHLLLVLTPPPPLPHPVSQQQVEGLYTSSCTEMIRLATGRLLAHTDPHFALFFAAVTYNSDLSCSDDVQFWPLLQWRCTTLTSVAVMYNSDLFCSDIQLWPLLQQRTTLTSVAVTYNSDLYTATLKPVGENISISFLGHFTPRDFWTSEGERMVQEGKKTNCCYQTKANCWISYG